MSLYIKRISPSGEVDFVTNHSEGKVKFGKVRRAYAFDSNIEIIECQSSLNFIELQKTGYFPSTSSDGIGTSKDYVPFKFVVENERTMSQHRNTLFKRVIGAFQT